MIEETLSPSLRLFIEAVLGFLAAPGEKPAGGEDLAKRFMYELTPEEKEYAFGYLLGYARSTGENLQKLVQQLGPAKTNTALGEAGKPRA